MLNEYRRFIPRTTGDLVETMIGVGLAILLRVGAL